MVEVRGSGRRTERNGRYAALVAVVWAALGGVLCAVALAVGPASAASAVGRAGPPAHADVQSVTPADGTRLERGPAALVVVFNEQVNPSFVQVALTRGGATVPLGAPSVSGGTVTVPVPPGSADAAGSYRLAFRVVSADGHPVSGSSEFTVAGAPAATPSASAAASPSASPSAAPSGTAPASAQPAAAPAAGELASGTPLAAALVAVLLVAGAGALLWRRRRPR